MKRTSPLKSTRKNHIEKKYINNKNDLLVNLTLYSGVKAKLNFELWLNENPDNHYLACVLKVAKKYQKLKKTKSHDSLEAKFNQFQLYVNFCKGKSLNPFSEEAYKSYVGKNGELRRLEALAISPYPYIFMYIHAYPGIPYTHHIYKCIPSICHTYAYGRMHIMYTHAYTDTLSCIVCTHTYQNIGNAYRMHTHAYA